jgi:hypothetical protein
MDSTEDLFKPYGDKRPRLHGDHARYPVGPHPEEPHDDPRYARMHADPSDGSRHDREAHRGHPGVRGVLLLLAQYKALVVVAALLLLVVTIGGIFALALLLPFVGTLLALVGAQDLSAPLADLPRLLGTLLVEAPKALLEYLAPLLQPKSALAGKA